MELSTHLLAQFLVVAEEEHIGRAAQRLSISQPPLTQAVHRLERGLGVTLLERVGRGVRLPPAGRAFALDAAALLQAQQAACDRARRVAAGLSGTVRLGYVGSLAYGWVPGVLRRAAEQLPDVAVELVQQPSAALLEALLDGALDAAVVRAPVPADRLDVRSVHWERLVLAVPAQHRYSGRRRVRMSELVDEPFVAFAPPVRQETADALHTACAAAGFVPRIVAEAVDLPGLLAWVIAGRALALVPADAAVLSGIDVRLLEVTGNGPGLRVEFVAVSRPDPDAAVARLLELLS